MTLRYTSLGSGSKGNCTVICSGSTTILVDCGFSRKRTVERMETRGIKASDVDALLLTHEHSDHMRGARLLAKTFDIPVVATSGTASKLDLDEIELQTFSVGEKLNFGDISIDTVDVPHDAQEPSQFVFGCEGRRFGLLTDIGHITPQVAESYSNCDALFVEANHDLDMLRNGFDPPTVKMRVSGDLGHLSNSQTSQFIDMVMHDGLHSIVIGHISQRNNSLGMLRQVFDRFEYQTQVTYATQDEGVEWTRI